VGLQKSLVQSRTRRASVVGRSTAILHRQQIHASLCCRSLPSFVTRRRRLTWDHQWSSVEPWLQGWLNDVLYPVVAWFIEGLVYFKTNEPIFTYII
jgi:hypothetical protein